MVNVYSKLIPSYGSIVEPLLRFTCKNIQFLWGKDQQDAFEQLKDTLMLDHILDHPYLNKPYKLYMDASDFCIRAVLCQDDDCDNE